MDLTTYFEKFKATKELVEVLNRTTHRNAVVERLCKEQHVSVDDLGSAEAIKFIADGKEKILGMQCIMNIDRNKDGTLIENYDSEYLGGINKYPKLCRARTTC